MIAEATTETTRILILGGEPDIRAAIPADQEFEDNESDFLPAFHIEEIGKALISSCPEFGHLLTAEIGFVWKRKGGKHQGKSVLAFCAKTSGLARYFSRKDFVVWVAADTAREHGVTNWQLEALLHHELLHADIDEETAKPAVRGHDAEMFNANVERYGLWSSDLGSARESIVQAALPTMGTVLPFGSRA